MNTALIGKEIRESHWKLVLGTIVLSLLGVALPPMYGMITDLMSQVEAGPEWIRNLMQIDQMQNYTYYLWSQWNSKNLYQVGILLAVLTGMSSVAGEVTNHTISFLLTRPVSRKFVYISKVFGGVIILAIAVAVSTTLMIIVSMFSTTQVIEVGRLVVATLITFIGLVLVYMLTLFFSTVIDEPVKAGGITVLTLLGVSVLGWFGATRKLSLFTHIGGGEYFIGGSFPFVSVGLMILCTLVLLLAGMAIMEKKQL